MRATIRNYIDAAEARREESGDKGFSLIELIVVVAILGILVAIAIPVFGSIQATAEQNAADQVAANAATQASAKLANGEALGAAATEFTNLSNGGDYVFAYDPAAAPTAIEDVCVTATAGTVVGEAGPGC